MRISSLSAAVLFTLVLLCTSFVACFDSDGDSDRGTSSVLLREGRFGRNYPGGEINIRLTMPSHWKPIDGPTYLVGPPYGVIDARPEAQLIDYKIIDPQTAESFTRIYDRKSESQIIDADGFQFRYWQRPSDEGDSESPAIMFDSIPGAPHDVNFQLVMEARDVNHEVAKAILEVAKSVQYSAGLPIFEIPTASAGPDIGWIKLDATSAATLDDVMFSLLAPKGWSHHPVAGFDSIPGEFIGQDASIAYDYGQYGVVCSGDPFQHVRTDNKWPELEFWEERINKTTFIFHRPVDNDRDDDGRPGTTGACAANLRESELYGPTNSNGPKQGLQIWSHVETREQQELVLAIIRTILTPANGPR